MAITDHINLTGTNVLIGPNDDSIGPRFPAMGRAYDPELLAQLRAAAAQLGIALAEGVYTGWSGPAFETAAEIRAIRILGGDAVGMSTVHETVVARHCGLRVAAISAITNLAEGMSEVPLSHEQTLTDAARAAEDLVRLLVALHPAARSGLMLVPELIRKKRDGGELSAAGDRGVRRWHHRRQRHRRAGRGVCDGVVWRGMSGAERVALTGRDDALRGCPALGPRPAGARQALDRRRR